MRNKNGEKERVKERGGGGGRDKKQDGGIEVERDGGRENDN